MSGPSDDAGTGEDLAASLDRKTEELREQLLELVDQLGELVRNGSADSKRSKRIVDLERLSRVYERLRKSLAEELARDAPEGLQTLLDVLTLEENGRQGKTGDPPQERTASGSARG
jgi:hypothetical protein